MHHPAPDNPLIRNTASTTLLYCANQLAKTLSTMRIQELDTVVAIEEKVHTLPFQLLHFSPSPTRLQYDDMLQRIALLAELRDQCSTVGQDGQYSVYTTQIQSVIEALHYELNKIKKE